MSSHQIDISAQGGLNPQKNQALKKGLIIGVIAIIGIIIYRAVKKKSRWQQIGNLDVFQGGDVGNSTIGVNQFEHQIQGFDAIQPASQLSDAFTKDDTWLYGATDEDLIWDTLDGLTTAQIRAVEEMYNKHYYSTLNLTLRDSFYDELSGTELDRALAYLDY
jgi:hypothetical protein